MKENNLTHQKYASLRSYGYKWILLFLIVIMYATFTGCGYSKEEKAQMQKYEKQASKNAVHYISEKYDFQANVLDADCETAESSGVPDFSPSATGDVLVHMEYEGHEFSVMISGEESTTDGSDNYQLEQMKQAIVEEMNILTGLSMKDMQVLYGSYYQAGMDLDDSGLVHAYYDGSNLSEVLSEEDCQIVCSYVGVDLSMIDAGVIKELVGDAEILLVSYRSEEDLANVRNREFNLGGTPLAYDIEDKALYVDEYRVIGGNEEAYVEYDLGQQNGIYYVPKDSAAQVVLTETVLDDASNWNGRGFINAQQILDTAYSIESESDVIYFFIPVDMLEDRGSEDTMGMIVYQYEGEEGTQYGRAVTSLSEDENYMVGTIYMRDYSNLKISVLRDIGTEE